MSNVSYNICDRCGEKDDWPQKIFHYSLDDIHRVSIGHLCDKCARDCLPNARWDWPA